MLPDQEHLPRLTLIFQDVLDIDDMQLSLETSAADVEGWDSLTHVRLMLTVERTFGIDMSAREIGRLCNIGDLLALIRSKKSA